MMPQGNSDDSKPLALHKGLKCACVCASVGVCTVGIYKADCDCVCFTTQTCEIGFTEKDYHHLILCNIPLSVHLITKVITKGTESGI